MAWGGPYGRMMAARPAAPMVVGTRATNVMVVDLLRAVPGVVLLIEKLFREEQVSMEAVLNSCHHAFHMQKDELEAAKVSCAQIDFLCTSLTPQEERVRLVDAEN